MRKKSLLYLIIKSKYIEVIFHLIGDGDQIDCYRELINKYKIDDHVLLYGRKTGESLEAIYNMADLAVDSLGRHRSGIEYNSSLKGKEYLAKGLPVVSGVRTELDRLNQFKYYLRVSADDSIFNFEDILEFYDNVYSQKDRNEIKHEIRTLCENMFSYEKCYEPVIDFFRKFE